MGVGLTDMAGPCDLCANHSGFRAQGHSPVTVGERPTRSDGEQGYVGA